MNESRTPSKTLLQDAGAVFSGVADADLDADVTRHMLTAIYRISAPLVLVPPLAGVIACAWLVDQRWILIPASLGAIVLGALLLVALRLILGFGWVLLRFLDRLTQLPAAVLSLNDEVGQLRGGVADLRSGVAELHGGVAELQGGVAELQGGVAELQGGVAELRDDVGPLSGVVDGLTGHVESLQTSLDTAQFWRAPSRLWKAASERPSTRDSHESGGTDADTPES